MLAGTEDGAPVPAGDGTTLLDEEGRPVVSRANPTLLSRVVTQTDGTLLRLEALDIVTDLANRLSEFARVREREGFRLVPVRRYRFFLTMSLIALAVSLGVRLVRWRGMF